MVANLTQSDDKSRGPCYLHGVTDPNETAYDPEYHIICAICAVKLWNIAQTGLAFDIRGDTVLVTTEQALIG